MSSFQRTVSDKTSQEGNKFIRTVTESVNGSIEEIIFQKEYGYTPEGIEYTKILKPHPNYN